MKDYNTIRTRANRLDTPDKATGEAIYVDDISKPGMLFGAILQSPHAHAEILSIDTTEAKKLPGVKAVITSKETGAIPYGVSPARYDETVLATDKVRYVGDEIAAVAATSLDIALKAVELIKVAYEILPAVFTIEDAIKEDAPQLHEKYKGNLNAKVHQEFGDVEKGLKESDIDRKSVV